MVKPYPSSFLPFSPMPEDWRAFLRPLAGKIRLRMVSCLNLRARHVLGELRRVGVQEVEMVGHIGAKAHGPADACLYFNGDAVDISIWHHELGKGPTRWYLQAGGDEDEEDDPGPTVPVDVGDWDDEDEEPVPKSVVVAMDGLKRVADVLREMQGAPHGRLTALASKAHFIIEDTYRDMKGPSQKRRWMYNSMNPNQTGPIASGTMVEEVRRNQQTVLVRTMDGSKEFPIGIRTLQVAFRRVP